jgi:PAS domain S-box-containing protein
MDGYQVQDGKNEFLAAALACIGDGVIATGVDGNILYMNPVAEEITGWRATEAFGRKFSEVFPITLMNTGEEARNPVEVAMETGRVIGLQNHSALITKAGKRYISASCSPIKGPSGELNGAVVAFRDIHRIRQMEDDLREERNNLQKIFEFSPIGMLVIDSDSNIKQANKAFLEMLESDISSVIGRKFGEGLYCSNSFVNGCGNLIIHKKIYYLN